MIYTKLNNLLKYKGSSKNLDCAIDYLGITHLDELEKGRVEINGDDVFGVVMEYETKDYDDGKFEAHKKYIDLQIVLEGREKIFSSALDDLSLTIPYDSKDDVMFFEGVARNEISLEYGAVAVYFPEDAHMPGIVVDEANKEKVKKIVVKVRVAE